MTPAEVRAIVERVVVEHGGGWKYCPSLSQYLRPFGSDGAMITGCAWVRVRNDGSVEPSIDVIGDEEEITLAVSLWPEMQRLCAMLREALR